MLFTKKVIITETQRGLLFKDEQFVSLLEPGVHRFRGWPGQYRVESVRVDDSLKFEVSSDVLNLADSHPQPFADVLLRWETGEQEVGLVYLDNVLKGLKIPGQRGGFWRGPRTVEVRKVSIGDELKIPAQQARHLFQISEIWEVADQETVPEGHVGFWLVDGELREVLEPGQHAWWTYGYESRIELMDTRLQNMEINGQEILTKDRVSLRINLGATWQVVDAPQARAALADHKDFLYRELQLALRTVVSTQTLDELLADKNLLNRQVQAIVTEQVAGYGLVLKTVGARDIVLPGDMKTILAQVVEAEKMAEANLIRRREETQATRSLHNTAKVMEGNPTLLRLKELETLEKITAQIDTLNVYGGLEGVMNNMVNLARHDQIA